MLRIPNEREALVEWAREITDECTASTEERAMTYTRASQYYYTGAFDSRGTIYNKVKPFVEKLGGFLMQPTDVRFNLVYDTDEAADVLERAELCSEKLSADYRQTDSDVKFADAVTWALINGCQLLKHRIDGQGFKIEPVHPQNFGVLSESILEIEEQEAICHVSFPTISRLRGLLDLWGVPDAGKIIQQILEARQSERDEEELTYFHQMVVGGLNPLGDAGTEPTGAGVVNVFPIPTPWRPQRRVSRTVRLCELWIKDANRGGDWTTLQLVYPDILVMGTYQRQNVSKIPGRQPFVKVQATPTPGYFWGRSVIADIQALQDVLNKRLTDIKILWDRNVNAPKAMSGFTQVTEEAYLKIMSEGGFVNDSNPNAKVQDLSQPPPPGYLEELQFLMQLFDEASGFTPIMSGQGEQGVRAGVHAQTLVRQSSPRLIDQAARLERQLAESAYLGFRIMQAMDATVYTTSDSKIAFPLAQMPDGFQIEVDSHSASPAFMEDNRQIAIALARAGVVDGEDLVHMLHPPGAQLILARLKQRQKAQAAAAQKQKQEELMRDVIGLPQHQQQAAGHRKR